MFSVNDALQFERDLETGDVTIHVEGMHVRVPRDSWVSAVAEVTHGGGQANHAAFKQMHIGPDEPRASA